MRKQLSLLRPSISGWPIIWGLWGLGDVRKLANNAMMAGNDITGFVSSADLNCMIFLLYAVLATHIHSGKCLFYWAMSGSDNRCIGQRRNNRNFTARHTHFSDDARCFSKILYIGQSACLKWIVEFIAVWSGLHTEAFGHKSSKLQI